MPSAPNSKAGSPTHSLRPPHPHRRSRSRPYSRSHRRLSHSRSTTADHKKADPPRIVFGNDAIASLPSELSKLGLSRPLIVCSPSRLSLADRIRSLLPDLDACFVTPDTHPGPAVLSGRDAVISVGGPRAVALARRISVKTRIPHICVPTTYSGAPGELSPPRGKREDARGGSSSHGSDGEGARRADEDERSLPAVILYDRKLTERRVRRFSAEAGVSPGSDAEAALRVATGSADAEADAALKPAEGQWSYIHLPII
ncbi:hypothetical protein J3F83DRAFT_712442 [Trichoderma novae-zelandiae]